MGTLFRFTLHKKLQAKVPEDETGHYRIGDDKISYIIQRKPRRKRSIALYIDPPGTLRFVAPVRTKTATIENILQRRTDWIAKRLADMQRRPSPLFPRNVQNGDTIHYLGNSYRLQITGDADVAQSWHLEKDSLVINIPNAALIAAKELQQDIRLELLLWYKKQARKILKERLEHWARELDVKYRSLKINSPTRQWGSCSIRNDIRLNWRVIVAPMDAIDYLVAHELCHVVHKNHSRRFWQLLATVMPDHKVRRKLLRSLDPGFSI